MLLLFGLLLLLLVALGTIGHTWLWAALAFIFWPAIVIIVVLVLAVVVALIASQIDRV